MVNQALARQKELNSEEDDFDTFGHVPILNAEPPAEIIMICLDTSASMDSEAGFPDMNRDEVEKDNEEEDEDDEFDVPQDEFSGWTSSTVLGYYILFV